MAAAAFALTLLALDVTFIKLVVGPLYSEAFGVDRVSILPAALAYLAMISSWGLIRGDPKKAALVGFAIYGTYAFTLKSMFQAYTTRMMVTEIVWGVIVMTVATLVARRV